MRYLVMWLMQCTAISSGHPCLKCSRHHYYVQQKLPQWASIQHISPSLCPYSQLAQLEAQQPWIRNPAHNWLCHYTFCALYILWSICHLQKFIFRKWEGHYCVFSFVSWYVLGEPPVSAHIWGIWNELFFTLWEKCMQMKKHLLYSATDNSLIKEKSTPDVTAMNHLSSEGLWKCCEKKF